MSILSLRQQAQLHDEWLNERLSTIVPRLMKAADVDCWVLIAREYNEDPVVKTMLPATWLSARRRTTLVFTAFGEERVAISRYGVGTAFPAAWSPEEQPDQWARLAEYLDAANPQRIAINRSNTFSLADGMTASEFDQFAKALPSHLGSRITDADQLAIGWLETRTPEELSIYPDVCKRAHGTLMTALSPAVIVPGKTTTDDVEWWLRQEVERQGYRTWFHPTVSCQRSSADAAAPAIGDDVIRHGDLIHIDFGIEYLGLHTDQQQHAYVLHPGEQAAPDGLQRGIAAGNRLQNIVLNAFAAGATGNRVLEDSLRIARNEGLKPTIYSHPIGVHGHGAGPTIGLWDQQEGVPGAGDYPISPDTAYSIELSVMVDVPEWNNQPIRIMLEEDAAFDGETIDFLDGRQTELWLI